MVITTHPTIAAFVAADEAGDDAALDRLLAPEAVLISPITGAWRFHGRETVREVMASAFDVVSDVSVHTVTGADDTWAIFARGRCGTEPFEECLLLRLDEAGLIHEITLLSRPVPGTLAVMGVIGGALHRRGVMSTAAATTSAAIKPIGAMLSLVERHVLPRLAPRRLGR